MSCSSWTYVLNISKIVFISAIIFLQFLRIFFANFCNANRRWNCEKKIKIYVFYLRPRAKIPTLKNWTDTKFFFSWKNVSKNHVFFMNVSVGKLHSQSHKIRHSNPQIKTSKSKLQIEKSPLPQNPPFPPRPSSFPAQKKTQNTCDYVLSQLLRDNVTTVNSDSAVICDSLKVKSTRLLDKTTEENYSRYHWHFDFLDRTWSNRSFSTIPSPNWKNRHCDGFDIDSYYVAIAIVFSIEVFDSLNFETRPCSVWTFQYSFI